MIVCDMVDRITTEQRSENMRRIRGKDTTPEMTVRRLVHGMGYRYRLHRTDLPGSPDLVFPSREKIIFVHGCFWHYHAPSRCKIAHTPKSNKTFWQEKLIRNRRRDARNRKALHKLGWQTLVIWECESKDEEKLSERINDFLEA